MSEPTSCCLALGGYCERCDQLVGLDGLHVTAVDRDDGGLLVVQVEWAARPAVSWHMRTAGSQCGWSTRRDLLAGEDRVAQAAQ